MVSVSGTNIRATMSASGGFTLEDVPAGDIELRFTSDGFDAGLTLDDVESSQTITIAVSMTGTSVELEAEERSLNGETQLEGRVESLPPTVAAATLVVAGRTVATTAGTVFRLNGAAAAFTSLAIGQRVHVKGEVVGSTLTARQIDIQNTNTDIPIPLNGIVQGFTGTAAAFSFTINGMLVRGDALTVFFGGSTFTDLANGVRAEVKGLQRDGFLYASRIHVNADGEEEDVEGSVTGVLTSKIGAAPALTLLIDGVTVKTDGATTVQRRSNTDDVSVLVVGMTLHATGIVQPDGSILAAKIQIREDPVGGAFVVSGSMGGVKGTCPALTFSVNGYDILTDGSTTFGSPCASLGSGTKVTVRGIVQAGGVVKATSLDTQ